MGNKKIIHYDLFAGIGGFSLAVDYVWGKRNVYHVFSEIEPFCQAVLKKHWPEGEYWGDIREFIANSTSKGYQRWEYKARQTSKYVTILTGGFPCQPFSHAGKKRGTQDNRFLWPEMFRAIQLIKPQWIIAENVCGILTIEGGLVFEQAYSDLEAEGYEVQTFIIPAVSVNAPHRRDRVWIIAHSISGDNRTKKQREFFKETDEQNKNRTQISSSRQPCRTNTIWESDRFKKDRILEVNNTSDPTSKRLEGGNRKRNNGFTQITQNSISKRRSGRRKNRRQILECKSTEAEDARPNSQDWGRDWKEVAFATCLCGVDDGLSRRMDGITISPAKHRRERLKALGNAIVPQVAIEILKAIKYQIEKE